jgi:hypothetical protein
MHFEFTVEHELGFSVFSSRLLATDLHAETSTSNHDEVFMPFLFQWPGNLEIQLKLFSAASRIMIYSHGMDSTENAVLL